ncbi:hypothetical protein [Aurantiacibacter flavus]|uniref:PEP-CTERM protein-sorting domain-containing protein n=1 Tax=Aurantiacibacter flavus TaxID=3145232 RepID=A0ABV0D1T8_9SPHN
MQVASRHSLYAFAARQPKFHFWLLSSLGFVVLASSFLSHDKRGLLFYDEPTALLAEDLTMMPEFITGGFGNRLVGDGSGRGERPNSLRRTIGPRGAAPGLAGDTAGQTAPGGAVAPAAAPAVPNFADATGPALASGPAAGGTPLGLPGFFGDGGGFGPTPIGFVPVPGSDGGGSGSSSGGDTPGPVVPAIPEPASWLMMIIAVFTLGSAIRRGNEDGAPLAT